MQCQLACSKTQQIYIIVALAVFAFVIIFYFSEHPGDYETQLLPVEEYNNTRSNQLFHYFNTQKLLNIRFKYVLNNENACNSSEDVVAVFIVTSYYGNVEARSSMRRAFSRLDLEKHQLRRVFLLAEAPQDKYTTQQSVNDESRRFGDIIQGNFSEAYRNLTYKHVMGLRWAGAYCSNAKYVIKMDDDTVVNMYMLQTILDSLQTIHSKPFISGYTLKNMKPIREPANKWYVTTKEYPANNYPTFVSGWFYITNPLSATKLAIMANYEKYFWIDDVFITGIVANKMKMKLVDISKYFVVNAEFLQCCLQDFDKQIDCDVYVGPNGGDDNMFFKFNEKVRTCSLEKQCKKRTKPLNETCVAERKVNLGKGAPVISDFRLI